MRDSRWSLQYEMRLLSTVVACPTSIDRESHEYGSVLSTPQAVQRRAVRRWIRGVAAEDGRDDQGDVYLVSMSG